MYTSLVIPNMSDNVGLSTPRGSGTSGYVQRNLAHIRPRDRGAPYPPKDADALRHKQRQPDKEILDHGRKRELYLKEYTYKLELLDDLEKEEEECVPRAVALPLTLTYNRLTEDERKEVEEKCAKFREDLLAKESGGRRKDGPREQFKGHQVHEMADAKLKEMDKWGRALKIPSNYEEGSHWKRQEERMKNALDGDDRDDKDRPRD